MRNPNDEYDRLHDHMTAIARERDYANQQLDAIKRLLDETTKELQLAVALMVLCAVLLSRTDK